MQVISLFSGIGGFELASEWAGWQNIVSCEINPFGRKVLEYYWPNAYHHDDIHTLNYEKIDQELTKRKGPNWRSDDIVLTGGFPCQPYSAAGKRLGKDDERHLWPEMLRIIREVQPKWIVGENVFGLVNWSGGLVFEEVQADLEAEGYEVQPYVLPAAAVNAPHRRDRVWFVAYKSSTRLERCAGKGLQRGGERLTDTCDKWLTSDADGNGQHERDGHNEVNTGEGGQHAQRHTEQGDGDGDASDAKSKSSRWKYEQRPKEGELGGCDSKSKRINGWQNFPTQPPVRKRDDGVPTELDGITFPKWRNESIKAYGNAIVPQLVYQIFKAINVYERITQIRP